MILAVSWKISKDLLKKSTQVYLTQIAENGPTQKYCDTLTHFLFATVSSPVKLKRKLSIF